MGTLLNSNYSFSGYGPLDEKLLVDAFADLPSSPFNGMIVAVDAEKCSYIYTEQGWKKIVNESDLDNYFTKTEVEGKLADIASGGTIDLESYATIEYVNIQISNIAKPEIPSKLSDLEDDIGYITELDVDKKIEEAQLSSGEIDLTNYYTKSEVEGLIDSYFANIKQAEDEEF